MGFVVLVVSHILSDYYLQTKRMAENKSRKIRCLVAHALVAGVTYMLLSFVLLGDYLISVSVIIIVSHFLIDFITSGAFFKLIKKERLIAQTKRLWMFVLDQVLHITVLFFTYYLLMDELPLLGYWSDLNNSNHEILNYLNHYLLILLMLLLIYKPTKITVEKVLVLAGVDEKLATDKQSTIIGYAERTIFFVSIIAGVPIIISFVIGMKTWAQSEKLKDRNHPFVGTFLIGSLTSLAVTLILCYSYLYIIEVFMS